MADFSALKTAIQTYIKQNGNEEITGDILQQILLSMVSSLGDDAINALSTALSAAITSLTNDIGDVSSAIQSAVSGLNHSLNTEAQTRAYQDQQLQNGINAEGSVRQAAISELNHSLNVEAQARAYGDLNEASIRQSEDNRLELRINGLSVDFDDLLEDVRNLIRNYNPIVIDGDVTNAPDEQDLTTTQNNLLKFKDNPYNPIIFSGMGKKFLRKNLRPLSPSYDFDGFVDDVTAQAQLSDYPERIFWDRINEHFVGLKNGVYYLAWTNDDAYVPVSTENIYMYDGNPYKWNGTDFYVDDEELPNVRNVLTQDMINETNTIYVIRYDYTLKEDITIPANCVLEFDGGSISGSYTVTGSNTGIKAGFVKIFNTDITLVGNWNVAEAYPEWFGAKGDGVTDDSEALAAAFKFDVVNCKASYIVSKQINVYSSKVYGGGLFTYSGNGLNMLFNFVGQSRISIDNITIHGNNLLGNAIIIEDGIDRAYVEIKDCVIGDLSGGTIKCSAIHLQDIVKLVTIENNLVYNVHHDQNTDIKVHGISVAQLDGNCKIANNRIVNIITANTTDSDGLKLFTRYNETATPDVSITLISNNVFKNCNGRCIKVQGANVCVENNYFSISGVSLINTPCVIDSQRDGIIIRGNKINVDNITITVSKLYLIRLNSMSNPLSRRAQHSVIEGNTITGYDQCHSFVYGYYEKVDYPVDIIIKNNYIDLSGCYPIYFYGANINAKIKVYIVDNIFNTNQMITLIGDFANTSDSSIYTKVAENVSMVIKNNESIGELTPIFNVTTPQYLSIYKLWIEGNTNMNDTIYGCNWSLSKLGNTKVYFDSDMLNDGSLADLPSGLDSIYGKNVAIEGVTKYYGGGGTRLYSRIKLFKPSTTSPYENNVLFIRTNIPV